jgi:hypothetical protein
VISIASLACWRTECPDQQKCPKQKQTQIEFQDLKTANSYSDLRGMELTLKNPPDIFLGF